MDGRVSSTSDLIITWFFRAKTAVKLPKKLRAVSGQAIKDAAKPKVQEIHYETGSSCTESEDEAVKTKVAVPKIEVPKDPTKLLEEVRQLNKQDFPDRKDVANTKDCGGDKKRLTTQQKFYQLLSTIKGQNVKVARLDEVDKQRSKLPIYSEEQGIVETINDNTVSFCVLHV
jgi:uncharacterized Ntn-hydrolase superfamily protein